MREFLNKLMKELDFPDEAQRYLEKVNMQLDENIRNDFLQMVHQFMKEDSRTSLSVLSEKLDDIAAKVHFSNYTLHLLFLMYCAQPLMDYYKKQDIPLDIYWNSMRDLTYKLLECKEVYNIWGTFVIEWFEGFYRRQRFGLGRFQYEKIAFPFDEYKKGDTTIMKGDTVYNIHIPSSGSMPKELRMDSYRKAYAFYRNEMEGKPMAIVCHSWLLYPGNRSIFPPHSNLLDFMNDFDIIKSETSDEFSHAWRIFGKKYNGSTEGLPKKTSLQRAFLDWIERGNPVGNGFGVLLFDGEKIV